MEDAFFGKLAGTGQQQQIAAQGQREAAAPMSDLSVCRPIQLPVLICALALAGCSGGGKGSGAPPPPPPPPISVATTSLPNGQVNHAYAATLEANGGKAPLSWAVTSGALPDGLSLTPTGALAGTPTTTAAATPITFTVRDSSDKAL